jgi:toxin ParE1/3/4
VKDKPVIPRELANGDVDDVIEHYPGQDAEQADLGFIEALERAYTHIGHHPATGSPRYAHELNLPGLRSWPLARYPHLVFYVERSDHIDVWRVLHGQRDTPAGLLGAAASDMGDAP